MNDINDGVQPMNVGSPNPAVTVVYMVVEYLVGNHLQLYKTIILSILLGQESSHEEIIEALETRYDDVAEGEVLLSELFSTTQGQKESLTE